VLIESRGCPFHPLLLAVTAALAQRLERAGPELFDITAMPLDVIAHQPRTVALDAPADPAGVEIARQDGQAQALPACRLVQKRALRSRDRG
jgi:hypothetical protein